MLRRPGWTGFLLAVVAVVALVDSGLTTATAGQVEVPTLTAAARPDVGRARTAKTSVPASVDSVRIGPIGPDRTATDLIEIRPSCCVRVADPVATPEPTVGSTESPKAAPGGSADGDPADWTGSNQMWLFGIFVLALVIGLFAYAALRARRRR